MNPKEFSINPAQAVVRAQSEIKVKVTLCSNIVKKYAYKLHVDVQGIGKSILTLPITARTIVPQIRIKTAFLNLGRCFVNHTYNENVLIENQSDLPAKYSLIEQTKNDNTTILYTSKKPQGIIPPNKTIAVPIDFVVMYVMECEEQLSFLQFGLPDHYLSTKVISKGEGPVVYCTPEKVDYGTVEVLNENTKIITMENESLIPALYNIDMLRKDTVFTVFPCKGTLQPGKSINLEVTAFLDDSLSFQDKMLVSVDKGQMVSV